MLVQRWLVAGSEVVRTCFRVGEEADQRWLGHFCLFQMYMRDSLHAIDHGVIIHVLRGILRIFYGNNTI